jgi:AcrR family transcriptional regulator
MAVRMSRAERREQTRQELLTAAEACFVSQGFHASSVDEVAERAGYTKGAVYSNFAAKEDLFFAVYQRRVEQVLTEVVPGLRQAGAEHAFDQLSWSNQLATGAIQRPDPDDGWRAVFFEFWAHVLRHPELRDRFAAIHARFLEPLADAVRQLADDRGLTLPSDVTASQVAVAWNAMEVGLALERLTQPQTVDVALARRMGRLLLDAVLDTTQPSASNDGTQQDRSIR